LSPTVARHHEGKKEKTGKERRVAGGKKDNGSDIEYPYHRYHDLLFSAHCCIVTARMASDQDYIIKLARDEQDSLFQSRMDQIHRGMLKFLRSPAIYVLVLLVSVGLAFGISHFGIVFGIIFIGAVIGIPAVLYSVADLKFGIVCLIVVSYSLGVKRFYEELPIGVALDVFSGAMFFGLLLDKWRKHDFTVAGNPISLVVWLWIIYNFLEFLNPMASREAWVYVIRGIALLMTFYFIVLQAVDNLKFVKVLINVWLVLTLISALYGLFQEFHGLLQIEKDWVAADDFRFNLIVNWGHYRIFSFLSDPTLFGILMAYTGLFCIALLPGPFKIWYKMFLTFCAVVMFMAMVYAGTRTAYAMVPAGLLFFVLVTLKKKTMIITGIIGVLGASIIFSDIRNLGPFLTTSSLERIRSAFKPSEDASYQVRQRSQAFIKPFIQSHPFGAGLGSIGAWSARFTPNSKLAKFAPDSGYRRVAVELGWLGLIVYCIFFATVLIVGVRNYYRMQDPLLKTYMAGLLGAIFSIVVANYPQEALIQVPTILIFYIMMALIIKLKKLDETMAKQAS